MPAKLTLLEEEWNRQPTAFARAKPSIKNLAHVWSLNALSPTKVIDSAGNAHGNFGVGTSGNPSGNSWRLDQGGWYIHFDNAGTGQVSSTDISVGSGGGSGSPLSNKFTILFRVRVANTTNNNILYGGEGSGSLEIRFTTSGRLEVLKTWTASMATSTDAIVANTWHWMAVSYDGAAVKIFIENRRDSTTSSSQTFNHNCQYFIGKAYTDTTERIQNGTSLQHFCVFNACLPDSEVLYYLRNPWQIFEPEEIPLFKPVVTAQYARPVSDVSAGGWTASTGSDLFAMLDEAAADDGDYITSTTASTCEVALGSLSDPALSTGHIVRYRISATGGGIIVRLREGSTTIASWTHDPAPASLTTYAQTLSGGEADSITNYAALKLQFEAIA